MYNKYSSRPAGGNTGFNGLSAGGHAFDRPGPGGDRMGGGAGGDRMGGGSSNGVYGATGYGSGQRDQFQAAREEPSRGLYGNDRKPEGDRSSFFGTRERVGQNNQFGGDRGAADAGRFGGSGDNGRFGGSADAGRFGNGDRDYQQSDRFSEGGGGGRSALLERPSPYGSTGRSENFSNNNAGGYSQSGYNKAPTNQAIPSDLLRSVAMKTASDMAAPGGHGKKDLDVHQISNIVAEKLVAALATNDTRKRPGSIWEAQQAARQEQPDTKRARTDDQQGDYGRPSPYAAPVKQMSDRQYGGQYDAPQQQAGRPYDPPRAQESAPIRPFDIHPQSSGRSFDGQQRGFDDRQQQAPGKQFDSPQRGFDDRQQFDSGRQLDGGRRYEEPQRQQLSGGPFGPPQRAFDDRQQANGRQFDAPQREQNNRPFDPPQRGLPDRQQNRPFDPPRDNFNRNGPQQGFGRQPERDPPKRDMGRFNSKPAPKPAPMRRTSPLIKRKPEAPVRKIVSPVKKEPVTRKSPVKEFIHKRPEAKKETAAFKKNDRFADRNRNEPNRRFNNRQEERRNIPVFNERRDIPVFDSRPRPRGLMDAEPTSSLPLDVRARLERPGRGLDEPSSLLIDLIKNLNHDKDRQREMDRPREPFMSRPDPFARPREQLGDRRDLDRGRAGPPRIPDRNHPLAFKANKLRPSDSWGAALWIRDMNFDLLRPVPKKMITSMQDKINPEDIYSPKRGMAILRSTAQHLYEKKVVQDVADIRENRPLINNLQDVGISSKIAVAMKVLIDVVLKRKKDVGPVSLRRWIDRCIWQEIHAEGGSTSARKRTLRIELPDNLGSKGDLDEKFNIAEHFSELGSVLNIALIPSKKAKMSFCLLTFADVASTHISMDQKHLYKGREMPIQLEVNKQTTRDERPVSFYKLVEQYAAADAPKGKTTDKTKTTDKPADKTKTDKPADKTKTDKPADKSKPADKPTEKPAGKDVKK